MRRFLAAFTGASLAVSAPASAQNNDNDYTPLSSRIKRDRQFPTEIENRWRSETSEVSRVRSRNMMTQFSRCMYDRSKEDALELLAKTDYGFVDFGQIGLDNNRALKNFGFQNCLSRVANTNGTGVQLRFSAGAMRQWLVQEAYFDRYEDGPTWVQPGNAILARRYPMSAEQGGVQAAMDLADCLVAADPYTADFFFRTMSGSDEEKRALDTLTPMLAPCLPDGQQVQLQIPLVRAWIGEALWHASTNNAPVVAAGGTQ